MAARSFQGLSCMRICLKFISGRCPLQQHHHRGRRSSPAPSQPTQRLNRQRQRRRQKPKSSSSASLARRQVGKPRSRDSSERFSISALARGDGWGKSPKSPSSFCIRMISTRRIQSTCLHISLELFLASHCRLLFQTLEGDALKDH